MAACRSGANQYENNSQAQVGLLDVRGGYKKSLPTKDLEKCIFRSAIVNSACHYWPVACSSQCRPKAVNG